MFRQEISQSYGTLILSKTATMIATGTAPILLCLIKLLGASANEGLANNVGVVITEMRQG